jgi:hypothetical protein
MRNNSKYLVLGLVILAGLFLRVYGWDKAFMWGHDHDLYSWIVKDIVVNNHQRLVGQVTSVDGVFIGSFYYYLMALGYLITGMEPWGAIIITSLINLVTMVSVWWIFKTTINLRAGWIGLALWASSLGLAIYEKWSVPTQPVLLWTIWFWWVSKKICENNKWGWIGYAILTGFVWQIHIGLIPLLPIPLLVAGFVNRKSFWKLKEMVKRKWFVSFIGLALLVNLPFVLFELKTNFSQTQSIVAATKIDKGGPTGWQKVEKVISTSGREIQQRWLVTIDGDYSKYWPILWLGLMLVVYKSNKKEKGDLILMNLAVVSLLAAQFMSKRVVSEYYFTAMAVFVIIMIVKAVYRMPVYLVGGLIVVYGVMNFAALEEKSDISDSLYYRQKVVEYIKKDMAINNYQCLAVNFITTPGNNVGYRYLLWVKGIKQVRPSDNKFPIYNIINPWLITEGENDIRIGRFGVIRPKNNVNYDWESCNKTEFEPDTMLGYVD